MPKDLRVASYKLELEFLIHIMKYHSICYEDYDGDEGFKDTIKRISSNEEESNYKPYNKYLRIVDSMISKLKKLKIQMIIDEDEKIIEAENSKTKYSYSRKKHYFVFLDKTYQFSYNHLSIDERRESALIICYLIFMHHQEFTLEIGKEIFGGDFTRDNFSKIRKDIKEITGFDLTKNQNGNYHLKDNNEI